MGVGVDIVTVDDDESRWRWTEKVVGDGADLVAARMPGELHELLRSPVRAQLGFLGGGSFGGGSFGGGLLVGGLLGGDVTLARLKDGEEVVKLPACNSSSPAPHSQSEDTMKYEVPWYQLGTSRYFVRSTEV